MKYTHGDDYTRIEMNARERAVLTLLLRRTEDESLSEPEQRLYDELDENL